MLLCFITQLGLQQIYTSQLNLLKLQLIYLPTYCSPNWLPQFILLSTRQSLGLTFVSEVNAGAT